MDGTTKQWENDRKSNKSDMHMSKHRKAHDYRTYSYTKGFAKFTLLDIESRDFVLGTSQIEL